MQSIVGEIAQKQNIKWGKIKEQLLRKASILMREVLGTEQN